MKPSQSFNLAAQSCAIARADFNQRGQLPAKKFGRDLVIQEEDLKLVKERKPGRPKKQSGKKVGRKK